MYPDARRVLLTAYADTATAITAINDVGIDHYLLKPWSPPEERLYPVIDELDEWVERAPPTFDGIRVAGTQLSATSFAVRDFLSANQLPYQWVDIDTDAPMRALVEAVEPGMARLPAVFFPDGTAVVQPSSRSLAEKAGLQTRAAQRFYDLVIVGGGPAGLAAAVFASSEGLRTLLIERNAPGGQAATSSSIEKYLGFPEGSSGMEVRRPEVDGLDDLVGAGVYYGSTLAEATRYRGRDVVVVGGANSAGQGAMFFSRYARTVTIVLRGPSLGLGMSQYLVDRISETANIIVASNSRVAAIRGSGRLEAITIADTITNETRELETAAMFIFIGTAPRTAMVDGLVERDPQGFILTGRDVVVDGHRPRGWTAERDPFPFETSVPGIFAAGDSRHGSGKRVAAAVGERSATVSMVHEYLRTV
jgi:thioredoxin reductase (NADPH)